LINITVNEQTESSRAQNVTFNDANPAWLQVVHNDLDATFGNVDNDDAPLGDFLKRPVRIRSFDWTPGTTFFERFNPWVEFYTNLRVINRISNFNLVRSNLHVRFLINGSPFHYGKILSGYTPRASAILDVSSDQFENVTAYDADFNCALSQKPHVFLDSTTSSGADIILPFISPLNYMSIVDSDWNTMGLIYMQSLSTLKHAQGSADKVNITVFAWAEEATLAIPTTKISDDLFPQSGCEYAAQMGLLNKVRDEYGNDFISKPAAVVANIAGRMKSLPMIGPYARASEAGAGALSSMAAVLGFSRPSTSRIGYNVQARPGGNYANTNVPDTSEKLTLDWKQEVTVDPRTVGLGSNDDLSIRSIVAHESYMGQFTWPQTFANEALLWNTVVTPCVGVGTSTAMYLTSPGFAALPFSYWRGTLRYRFVIEASAYHRGRLKVVYDPNQVYSTSDYQTQYTHVIDLHSERDFTIDVGWGNKHTYKNCTTGLPQYANQASTGAILAPQNDSFNNGSIGVYVVNQLTGPDDAIDNDVKISVFVSMGEDAEFFAPSDFVMSTTSYFPQSGVEIEEQYEAQVGEDAAANDSEPSKPSPQSTEMALASHVLQDDKAVMVYYGDPICSFRALLKRYNYHTSLRWDLTGMTRAILYRARYRHWQFPFYRGSNVANTNGTRDLTNGASGVNYAAMTLLNYVTPAFVGYRGGIRWKAYLVDSAQSVSHQRYTRVNAFPTGLRNGYRVDTYTQDAPGQAQAASDDELFYNGKNTNMGATLVATRLNNVLEAEIPYHSDKRFYPARHCLAAEIQEDQCDLATYELSTVSAPEYCKTMFFCAAADDFSLFMYQGAPKIYLYQAVALP